MNKQSILDTLKEELAKGTITANDLKSLISKGPSDISTNKVSSHEGLVSSWNIVQVLYIVGGLIIFSGISWLLSENWSEFGIILKLFLTFGTSIIFLISGKILLDISEKNIPLSSLSLVSLLVSILTFPVGVVVIMGYYGFNLNTPLHLLVFAAVTFFYSLIVYLLTKQDISLIFLILSAILTYFGFGYFVLSDVDSSVIQNLFFISIAVGFVLFGVWLSTLKKGIFEINFLNLFAKIIFQGIGLIILFSSMFALSGTANFPVNFTELFWELMVLPVIAGVLILSNKIKSNTLLLVGGVFLLVYIIKTVFRYLSDTSLGTPGALLIAGFLVVFASYLLIEYRGISRPANGG